MFNYKYYKNKVFENPKVAILNFTGPGMYTKVMRDFIFQIMIKKIIIKKLDTKFNGNGIFKLKGSSSKTLYRTKLYLQKNQKNMLIN